MGSANRREVEIAVLHEALQYNPDSGVLTWKERPRNHFASVGAWLRWNKQFSGTRAGANHGRYRQVCVNAVRMKEHRVVWAMVHGFWPPEEIDHINRNGHDNRIDNLRSCSRGENCRNRSTFKNNVLGVRCVRFDKGKYIVRIQRGGVRRTVGRFDSLEEAKVVAEQHTRIS